MPRALRPTAALALVVLAGALSVGSAADLTVWTAPALTKVFPDSPAGSGNAIRLQACRNEVEWGQIVFRSPEPMTLRLSVSDLTSASGRVISTSQVSLHPAVYVHVSHLSGNGQRERYWPEVLPVGDTVALGPNRNQPIYVGVRVPEGAVPGLYEGEVVVRRSPPSPPSAGVSPAQAWSGEGGAASTLAGGTPALGGGTIALAGGTPALGQGVSALDGGEVRIPIRLRVWPLTIPRTPTTRTSYYVWWDGIAKRFGLDGGPADSRPLQRQRVFDRFFAFMLDHRLCPMSLPVDIRHADRYMRDPRVNGVRLPYGGTDQELADAIAFVKRKGWLERCFYYLLDEPPRRSWPEVWAAANRLVGLDPLTPRLDTIQPEPELEGAISIWCPNVESVYLYDDRIAALTGVRGVTDPDGSRSVTAPTRDGSRSVTPPTRDGSGSVTAPTPDRSRSVTAPTTAPPEVWWYTCVFPKYPYPTFLLDDDAIAPRLLFWAQPRHGLTGSLYINTIHWGPEGNDPWAEAAADPVLLNNNDGLLMYTGRGTTLADAHPVTGVRLEMIRDGLEDVELCNMLGREITRLAGPAAARQHLAALASQVLPDLRHADRDPRHLLALRERVVDEVLTLQSDPQALPGLLALPLRVGADGGSRMSPPPPIAEDKFAVALRGTPVVDGKLDDACWQAAQAANAPGTRTIVTRFRNLTGRIWPSQETTVVCLHDDANLYFAFRCGEPEVAKLTPLSEQPELARVDRVAVALGTGGQERWFVVTLEGARLEGSLQQPRPVRGVGWEAKTHLGADGYTVEMRLPIPPSSSAGFQAPQPSSAGFQPAQSSSATMTTLGGLEARTTEQHRPQVRTTEQHGPQARTTEQHGPQVRTTEQRGPRARPAEQRGLEARTTTPVTFNLFRFAAPGQETLYFTGRHSSKQSPFQLGTLELR